VVQKPVSVRVHKINITLAMRRRSGVINGHPIVILAVGLCNTIAIPYHRSASTICEATIIPTPALTSSTILTTM
jgi:hypothetical protein